MSYNESLSTNSNYPPMSQSEWNNAPWNQSEPKSQKIKVTISVTLSKTVDIRVNDYIVEEIEDEDGYRGINYDFSDCNLIEAAKEQILMPQDVYNFIKNSSKSDIKKIKDLEEIEDLKDWTVDDIDVELE